MKHRPKKPDPLLARLTADRVLSGRATKNQVQAILNKFKQMEGVPSIDIEQPEKTDIEKADKDQDIPENSFPEQTGETK